MLKWYWYVHVPFKQRLELLKKHQSAPVHEVEQAEQILSAWKEKVKKQDTEVNERESKLNQLQSEGLFWHYMHGEYN